MTYAPPPAVCLVSALSLNTLVSTVHAQTDEPPANYRTPPNDDELGSWLQNMVWHHRFTNYERRQVTGLFLTETNPL